MKGDPDVRQPGIDASPTKGVLQPWSAAPAPWGPPDREGEKPKIGKEAGLSCRMGHKQKAEGTQNWGSCFSTDLGDNCQGGRWDLGLRKCLPGWT